MIKATVQDFTFTFKQQQQQPFCGYYTGQHALADTSCKELQNFVGAKFYCPHAIADGNQRIRIRKKIPEFSSTVLMRHVYTVSKHKKT